MRTRNKIASNLSLIFLAFILAIFSMCCWSGDRVNCLTFAESYSKITGAKVVVGIYRPVRSTYHAWVIRGDGMCMDQMRIFNCNDDRYKALAMPNDNQINQLMFVLHL